MIRSSRRIDPGDPIPRGGIRATGAQRHLAGPAESADRTPRAGGARWPAAGPRRPPQPGARRGGPATPRRTRCRSRAPPPPRQPRRQAGSATATEGCTIFPVRLGGRPPGPRVPLEPGRHVLVSLPLADRRVALGLTRHTAIVGTRSACGGGAHQLHPGLCGIAARPDPARHERRSELPMRERHRSGKSSQNQDLFQLQSTTDFDHDCGLPRTLKR
jgi:hypothetical protein